MRNKKPFWLVFILAFFIAGKELPAQEAPIALPAAAVSVSGEKPAPALLAFRVVQEESATFATILANASFNYSAHAGELPLRYVVDMPGLLVSPDQVQSVEVNSGAVRTIRLVRDEQGSEAPCLVVELEGPSQCRTFANASGTGLLVRVDEAGAAVASEVPESPSAQPAVEVASVVGGEPSVALSPTGPGYGSGPSVEGVEAVPVVAGIPEPTEIPSPVAAESQLALAEGAPLPSAGAEAQGAVLSVPVPPKEEAVSTLASTSLSPVAASPAGGEEEGAAEAVSLAPEIAKSVEVPSSHEEVSLASSAAGAGPEVTEGKAPVMVAAASLPSSVVSQGPVEGETSLSPSVATWTAAPVVEAKPPVALAMVPSSLRSSAVVKVSLVEGDGKGAGSAGAPAPGHVSVDFVDTALTDVFKSLAFQSGKDILVKQDVKGTVTLRLQDMPLDEAVNLIASMYDLSVKTVGDVYLVEPRIAAGGAPGVEAPQSEVYNLRTLSADSAVGIVGLVPTVKAVPVAGQKAILLLGPEADVTLALDLLGKVDGMPGVTPDGLVTKVLGLKYASPQAVAQAIRNALPGLTVTVEPELKAITVKGSVADVAAAEQMIGELDKETGPGPVAATTAKAAIKVQYISASALAGKLRQLLPDAEITFDEDLKAIFISGSQEDVETARAIAGSVDVAPAAAAGGAEAGTDVIIRDLEYATPAEAKAFLEGASDKVHVSTAADTDRIVISLPRGMFATVKQLVESFDVPPKEVVVEALITDMSRELSRQLGFAWDFGGTSGIQFIAPGTTEGVGFPTWQRGAVTITSVLSAIEGDTNSKLLARPRIRTIDAKEASILIGEKLIFQIASISGGTVLYTIREEKVGINLTLTPRITNDGHVLLTVHPEVSTLTGFNVQGYPNIATREADSTVRLKDGETLVMGGLIREEEIESMSKVPILSEVPILGGLFKRHTKTSRPSEVLIFVTPHIVGGREEL